MRIAAHISSRRAIGFAVLLLLAAGGIVWETWLQDRLVPKRLGVVAEGLIYRSGRLSPAVLKATLREYRIRRIVDLTLPDPADAAQRAEKALAAELGVEYRNYPLYGSGLGEVWSYAHTLAVMAYAGKEGKPVLVHCSAGVQRTGGVVAAYRLLLEKRPPAEAYAELIRYGWDPVQDRILTDFLNSRMAEIADRLLEMQLIDAMPDPLPVLGP